MGRRPLLVPHRKGYVMEPLKNDLDPKDNESKNPDQKIKSQVDRVTINKDESEKINTWLQQIKESTKGFLDLTRSDLVNYLIKAHLDVLTAKEIKKIRLAHYSLIKHLNWITPQLKKALEDNNHELVFQLQRELRSLEMGVIKNAESASSDAQSTSLKTTRKQRVKKFKSEAGADKNEANKSQIFQVDRQLRSRHLYFFCTFIFIRLIAH